MRILVARLDSAGDVILAGPAVRAAAARGHVTLLCGPEGEAAARLLPDVDEVLVWDAPWTGFSPPEVDSGSVIRLIDLLTDRSFDAAAILTSFHQSPLPLALILRMAGVTEIAAVSIDYPGSLLDHRVAYQENLHEMEQSLEVTAALGLPRPDDDRLRLSIPEPGAAFPQPGFVVVHPAASVPARSLPDRLVEQSIPRLIGSGRRVVVTGTAAERRRLPLSPQPGMEDRRGSTTFAELTTLIAAADAIVAGNTGPAHVAAATSTPVVSVFAPVVSARRWRPWKVPAVLLGDQTVPCAGCRSRICPLEIQTCTAGIRATEVVRALDRLAPIAAGKPT